MDNPISTPGYFERAVTLHHADCETLRAAVDPNDASRLLADVDGDLGEKLAAYVVPARRAYDGMRRQIGHLGGLLILAEAGGREVLALTALTDARDKWKEIGELVSSLKTPGKLEAHRFALWQAHGLLNEALLLFPDIGKPGNDAGPKIAERLERAYAVLQGVAEPRVGMTMVDFSNACCTCARHA